MKTVEKYKQEQIMHVKRTGGYNALREADDIYNDFNREQIAAYHREHGFAYIGHINFYDEECKKIAAGERLPYTAYKEGDMVYNFGCDFCIPTEDAILAALIKQWNTDGVAIGHNAMQSIIAITNRIDNIGGLQFLWY
jgi:hypothetical protein